MLKLLGVWCDGKSTRQEARKSLYKALGPGVLHFLKRGWVNLSLSFITGLKIPRHRNKKKSGVITDLLSFIFILRKAFPKISYTAFIIYCFNQLGYFSKLEFSKG